MDLYHLRLVLTFLVSDNEEDQVRSNHDGLKPITEEDNCNITNICCRMRRGGTLSALERIN